MQWVKKDDRLGAVVFLLNFAASKLPPDDENNIPVIHSIGYLPFQQLGIPGA